MEDGILIINKPKGMTSHDIVSKIKKLTGKKVGHTGTLDPLAQGVLPILIGKGTLCSKYLINHDKEYEVIIKLGKTTKTLDEEGEIIEEKSVPNESLEEENIKKILKSFKGKQQQIPPIYSAIKVNGKKLYEYARKGQEVEIKPREIKIYDIKLEEIYKQEKQIKLKVKCSKGTYIRSLCFDISKKLKTIGYMKELKRLKVGKFSIENSFKLENNEEIDKKNIEKNIITLEKLFEKNNRIDLDDFKTKHFLNGVKITIKSEDNIYNIYNNNIFLGTGIIKNNLLKRDIIIKTTSYI